MLSFVPMCYIFGGVSLDVGQFSLGVQLSSANCYIKPDYHVYCSQDNFRPV